MVIKLIAFAMVVSLAYSILHFLIVCVGEITAVVATMGIAHFIIKKVGI